MKSYSWKNSYSSYIKQIFTVWCFLETKKNLSNTLDVVNWNSYSVGLLVDTLPSASFTQCYLSYTRWYCLMCRTMQNWQEQLYCTYLLLHVTVHTCKEWQQKNPLPFKGYYHKQDTTLTRTWRMSCTCLKLLQIKKDLVMPETLRNAGPSQRYDICQAEATFLKLPWSQ